FAVNESLADAAGEAEGDAAAAGLLVRRHMRGERGAGADVEAGREADGLEMRGDAVGVRGTADAALGCEAEGQYHAERHRLAMEERIREAGLRLQRVGDGVAEIE